MFAAMRRLHPRGPESRGIAVDADGAMWGPDCGLARRTTAGFRCLAPGEARAIRAIVLGQNHDPDWLFKQSQRVAQALAAGETALAQIYGLRIPPGDLDGAALRWVAAAARPIKANFNPDEPRIPQGGPGAGEWTDEDAIEEPAAIGAKKGTATDKLENYRIDSLMG